MRISDCGLRIGFASLNPKFEIRDPKLIAKP